MTDFKALLSQEDKIKQAIKRINYRFLQLGEGTPIHEVKSKLAAKRSVLVKMKEDRFLQVIANRYFPTLLSVESENEPTIWTHATDCTELVLRALKRLYEEFGQRHFDRGEVLEAAKPLSRHVNAELIRTGMLFSTEFSAYRTEWGAAMDGAKSISVSDGIIDYTDFQTAWTEEQLRRNSEAAELGFIPRSDHLPPLVELCKRRNHKLSGMV